MHLKRFHSLFLAAVVCGLLPTESFGGDGDIIKRPSDELNIREVNHEITTGPAFCEALLNLISSVPIPQGAFSHPVEDYFSGLNLMLANSSYLAVSNDLSNYRDLNSLERVEDTVKNYKPGTKSEEARRQQGLQFYDLFKGAEERGDSLALASTIFLVYSVNQTMNSVLFHSFAGRTQLNYDFLGRMLDADRKDPRFSLTIPRLHSAWSQVGDETRIKFLEWLGEIFDEGVKHYTATTYNFESDSNSNNTPSVTIEKLLPDLKFGLGDYLKHHSVHGNKQELTKQYYRMLAAKLLSIYGIDARSYVSLGASRPPALGAHKPLPLAKNAEKLLP